MIHEEICTYEVCKLAKDKGFPQQYDSLTHIYGEKDSFNVGIDLKLKKCEGTLFDISEWEPCLNDIVAPTQSLLQRWLREEKNIDIAIVPLYTVGYSYIIYNIQCRDNRVVNTNAGYATYELALEDAELYCLKNL